MIADSTAYLLTHTSARIFLYVVTQSADAAAAARLKVAVGSAESEVENREEGTLGQSTGESSSSNNRVNLLGAGVGLETDSSPAIPSPTNSGVHEYDLVLERQAGSDARGDGSRLRGTP